MLILGRDKILKKEAKNRTHLPMVGLIMCKYVCVCVPKTMMILGPKNITKEAKNCTHLPKVGLIMCTYVCVCVCVYIPKTMIPGREKIAKDAKNRTHLPKVGRLASF
jgi:hypothetical protein